MASLTSHPIEAELTPKSSKAPDSPFGSFIPAGSYLRSSRAAALQNPASPRAAYVLAALPEAHIPPPPIRPSAGPRHGTIVRSRSRVFDAATKPAPSYKLKERSGDPVGKWVFIVNGTKLKQWDELSPRLVKQISGAEVRICITKKRGHAIQLAELAARAGADLIAAVGGDGTLNEVVDGVMRAGVLGDDGLPRATLTVLPLGTACDFHRSMCWDPLDFEKGLWRIGHEGSVAILDVARLECEGPDGGAVTRHFINVASCGASARAALALKKWRWLGAAGAYRAAALAALFRYKRRPLGVRVDGGEWERLRGGSMVAVGNGSYFGHGLHIAPEANPYDGLLQVVCADQLGPLDFLVKSWRLRMGTHLGLKGFSSSEGAVVEVAEWGNKRRAPGTPTYTAAAGAGGWAPARGSPSPFLDDTVSLPSSTRSAATPDEASDAGGSSSASAPAAATPDATPAPSSAPSATATPEAVLTRALPSTVSISPSGVDSEWASGSTPAGDSASASDSLTRVTSWDRLGLAARRRVKPRNGKEGKKKKKKRAEEEVEYGAVPVEVDGEVIGHAPFTVTVLPKAIKFKI